MNRGSSSMRSCGGVGLVCCLALALRVPQACAAESVAPVATAMPLLSLLQVLFGLALVLAAIAGSAWLLKRMGPGQVAAMGALRVVGGVAVGPKERVVLVDVGDVRLVLGVAPGHVTTLHQMPRPVDEPFHQPAEPMVSQFQDRLRALLNKKGRAQDVE